MVAHWAVRYERLHTNFVYKNEIYDYYAPNNTNLAARVQYWPKQSVQKTKTEIMLWAERWTE